jgi:hypothetical protein
MFEGSVYRTKCSCINLDYSMQMHLIPGNSDVALITMAPQEGKYR